MAIKWNKIKSNAKKKDKEDTLRNLYEESADRASAISKATREGRSIDSNFAEQSEGISDLYSKYLKRNRTYIKNNYGNSAYNALYSDMVKMRNATKNANITDDYTAWRSNDATSAATNKSKESILDKDYNSLSYNDKQKYLAAAERQAKQNKWGSFIGGLMSASAASTSSGEMSKGFAEQSQNAFSNYAAASQAQSEYKRASADLYNETITNENLKIIKDNKDLSDLVDKAYKEKVKLDAFQKDVQIGINTHQNDPLYADAISSYKTYMDKIDSLGYDANELLDTYTREQNRKSAAEQESAVKKFAEKHPVAAGAAYVGANVMQTDAAVESLSQGISNAINGEYKPIDVNSPAFAPTRYRETTSETISNNIQQEVQDKTNSTFWGNAASFAYQTGLSMGDFLSLAVLPEPVTLAVMGTSAGVATVKDATDRGLSADQALLTGVAAGLAETFFERFSLENFKALKAGGKAGVKNFVTDALKQSFTEGSEEFFTDIANAITDQIINGDMSQLEIQYKELLKQYNGDESAAKKALASRFGLQLAESFAGGALSGGLIGSFGGAMGQYRLNNIGKDIRSGNSEITDIPTLINVASALGDNSAAYKLYSKDIQSSKNVSNAKIGELYVTTLNDIQQKFNSAENISELTKQVGAITDAIDASNPDGITADELSVTVAQMFQEKANEFMSAAVKTSNKPVAKTSAPAEKPVTKNVASKASNEEQQASPVKTSFKVNASTGGNPITITTVDYTNDDEGIVFKTATGDTVKFTDIDFNDKTTDKIVSDAIEPYQNITLGKHGANEFIKVMSSEFAGDNYDKNRYSKFEETAKMFYYLGRSGLTFQNVLNDNSANNSIALLGEQTAKAMLEAGRQDAALNTESVDKRYGKDRKANVKTTGEASGKYVNETKETDIDVLGKAIAKHLGVDIYLGGYNTESNGKLITNKGIVELFNGSKRGVAHAVGHELIGEVTRAYNREDYNRIVDTILNYAAEISGAKSVADMTQKYYDVYLSEKGTTIQDAREELANDLISSLVFGNEHGQKVFAEHLASKQDKSLIDKFKDFVQKIIEAINNHFNKENLNSVERSMLELDKERAENFVKEIMNAWDVAAENQKASNGTETTAEESNTKNSRDIDYLNAVEEGDEETAQRYIDDAAMQWGAYSVDGKTPLKLYHGTANFGFTEFDLMRMDDKRSIFLTSDILTAQTYSDVDKPTRLPKAKPSVDYESMSLEELVEPLRNKYIEDGAAPNKFGLEYISPEAINDLIPKVLKELKSALDVAEKVAEKDKTTAGYIQYLTDYYNEFRSYVYKNKYIASSALRSVNDFLWRLDNFFSDNVQPLDDYLDLMSDTNLLTRTYSFRDEGVILKNGIGGGISLSKSDVIEKLNESPDNAGNYSLYTKLNNPLVVDAKGRNWYDIRLSPEENESLMTSEQKDALNRLTKFINDLYAAGFYDEDYITVDDFKSRTGAAKRRDFREFMASAYSGEWDTSDFPWGEYGSKIVFDSDMIRLQHAYQQTYRTREIAEKAQALGYDGVVFKDIVDNGGRGTMPSDVAPYIIDVFTPYNVKSADPVTYDNNGEVIPPSQRFTEDKDIRFSLDVPVEETKDLIAVHNLSETKLLKSLRLGGLPMPSIAISRAQYGHGEFGDISLVFPKSTINPATGRNAVWSGDAYTPTFPQVDYKIRKSAKDEAEDKVAGLLAERGYNLNTFDYLQFDSDTIADKVKYDDLIRYYKGKTGIMAAYLIDKGVEFKPVMLERRLDGFGKFDNETVIEVANTIDADTIRKAVEGYINEKDLAPQLADIAEAVFERNNGGRAEALKAIGNKPLYSADDFSYSEANALLTAAFKYNLHGVEQAVNPSETDKLLSNLITDDAEYEKWVKDLFTDIVEKEGIRNNRDYYDRYGNRRNFEALHYELNLENVVRAMKEKGKQGIGAFGGNIFGASKVEYNSIADIRANKDKLIDASSSEVKEAYEEKRTELSNRLYELAKAIPNYSDFSTTDAAADVLIEAVLKFSTKTGMDNYIRKELEGWGTYSPSIVDDLMAIVDDIRALPAAYFEAKPQRAVRFNEIYTAVIPDNSSAELKDALDNAGVKYQTYKANDEQSRTDVLNSLDEVKFSKDVDDDVNVPSLIRENKKLQKTVDYYKLMLGYNSGHKVDRQQIHKIAVNLRKAYNTTVPVEDIESELTELFDYISSGQATWETISDMGIRLGKYIVENQKGELTAEQQEALDKLKTYAIAISDEQREEIKYYYGNVAKWMNIVRKGVKYSTTGVPLDTVWQELAADMPYYFDKDANSQDMPIILAEAVEAITDKTVNDYGYTPDEMAQSIMLDLYDQYFDIPEIVTPLDEAKKKLNEERTKNRERLEEVKRKDKEKYDAAVKKHLEELESYKGTIKALKEDALIHIANEKAKYEYKARKQKETQERAKLRKDIKKQLGKILSMAANPTKEKHIPNAIIEGVKTLAESITLDETQVDAKLKEKLDNFRDGFIEAGESKDSHYQIISELFNDYIRDKIEELTRTYGNIPLKELPAPALREIKDLVVMTGQSINNINRLFNRERNATISGYASVVKQDMAKMKQEVLRDGAYKGFFYDLMKPEYFFEYLNSPTMLKLYHDLRNGEDTWINLYGEAEQFKNELRKKVGYNDWDFDAVHTFKTSNGDIELTLGEMLAIYANSLGEHTRKNLIGGGFQYAPQSKKGLARFKKSRNDHDTHRLTIDDVNAITSELTKEQLQYVKQFINFMSTTAGEWGNQVTRELYGVELYKEKSYYPSLIAGDFRGSKLADKTPPQTRQLVNSGFSKAIVPEVKMPIKLGEFDNTVMNHLVNMMSYRAFVLPLENFNRVYHYVDVTTETDGTLKYDSVEAQLKNAFGGKADAYITHLLEDINGGAIASTDYTNKLISLFKKGAVFASASVVVQQPSAIGRAIAIIDPKYFVGLPTKGFSRSEYNEMLEYCPIARIKQLGFFDTGLAYSAVESLNRKEYEGMDKVKAFVTDGSYRDAGMSFFAQKADEITWTHIWNACKNEAKDKYSNLSKEEQLKNAADRFTEVITKTQVYDSVFSRAGVMRNKGTGMKMATAFMAEPLTAFNMLTNAITQTKRGNMSKTQGARVLGSLVLASAINAVLQTLVTAARHDKDDDDWKEVYLAELLPNFLDNINPTKQVPILRDVISIFDGYDVTRADMSIIVDLEKALENLQKDSVSMPDKIMGLAGAISNCFGLPLRNVYRDVSGAVNVVKDMFDDYHFDDKNAKEKFKEEMNNISSLQFLNKTFGVEVFTTGTSARYDKMFKLLDKGKPQDAKAVLKEIKEIEQKAGKDEKTINSNIKRKFTEHYKKEYLNGDYNTKEHIVTYLTNTGVYGTRADVKKYIDTYWREDKEEKDK